MSSTITAMFDSRSDAEAAKSRLQNASIDAEYVQIHDKSSSGHRDEGYSTHEDRGIWGSIKNAFLPDEDRHTYEEGLRRGGVLLTADVEDDRVDDAVRALDDAGSIDVDERADTWRASGWDYAAPTSGSESLGAIDTPQASEQVAGSQQEEVMPVVEEQLVVGKRDVNRGGVRVRSYVTETPVHEQVRLRDEQIHVERRAVDQPLSAADTDAFGERTIEMTASGEEAVIGKTARVVEEVVISKTAEERVEDINDTVRKTDIEVEDDLDGDPTPSIPDTTSKPI